MLQYLVVSIFYIILDIFESSSIYFIYYCLDEMYTFIISSSSIYMFVLFFILNLIKNTFIYYNDLNLNIHSFKSFFFILHNIVTSYFSYNKNLFFLLVTFIFVFIFFNNFIGLIPFSITINSHFNITGFLSFMFWLGMIFIGLVLFSTKFFSMFCIQGIPSILIPFLALIEILSYFFRFISLSLRLFANIVAGHILLETIFLFLFGSTLNNNNLKLTSFVSIIIPILLFIALILFETVIASLQAYIFVILFLIYLKDSLYLH